MDAPNVVNTTKNEVDNNKRKLVKQAGGGSATNGANLSSLPRP